MTGENTRHTTLSNTVLVCACICVKYQKMLHFEFKTPLPKCTLYTTVLCYSNDAIGLCESELCSCCLLQLQKNNTHVCHMKNVEIITL